MSQKEYQDLKTARSFLVLGEMDNACAHYAKVSQDHPEEVAEAEFFVAYWAYQDLLAENDAASAVNAFKAMAACVENAVKCVKESDEEEIGKILIVTAMVETYAPITRYLYTRRISTSSSTIETGVLGLYALGDAIKNAFGANPETMKQAAEAWKEGVSIQRQFHAYKYQGARAEDYVAKIQKVEPNYTMPSKAGCISVAK